MEAYELRRGRYKNLTLRLVPPHGTLRVSAPWFLPRFVVDKFVNERTEWIAEKRRTMVPAPIQDPDDRVWVWGTAHRLSIQSPGKLPRVIHDPEAHEIVLRVPPAWNSAQRQKVLDRWESSRVEAALDEMVPAWSARLGLRVDRWTVKRLRSRWGSCRPDARSLVFNARLGAFPRFCLEHVVVHELAHLVEVRHNARFHALVESWLPGAAEVRKILKAGPGARAWPVASPGPISTSGEETEP